MCVFRPLKNWNGIMVYVLSMHLLLWKLRHKTSDVSPTINTHSMYMCRLYSRRQVHLYTYLYPIPAMSLVLYGMPQVQSSINSIHV